MHSDPRAAAPAVAAPNPAGEAVPVLGAGGAATWARLALIGLPGSGKSAVGRALAARLRRRYVDTDAAVEAAAGRSVAAIFAAEGEAGFRARERQALEAALEEAAPSVIACGGGLPVDLSSRRRLLDAAVVVWLDGPDELLLSRLGDAAERPLLSVEPAAALHRLRAARAQLYSEAHLRVDVSDADLETVCDRIEDAMGGARLLPDEALAAAVASAAPPHAAGATQLGMARGGVAGDAATTVVEETEPMPHVDVGIGLLDGVGALLPTATRRVAVVCDRATLAAGRAVLRSVRASGRTGTILALRGGERLKTWGRAGRLCDALHRAHLERGDCVVAVGGGTVGDLAGFAASVYLRGIACIQVPTTLLAMVDSAIGGKTGVNLARGKNLLGSFSQPRAVVCDLAVLRSLPRRPFLAAMAEVVKSAMILPAPRLFVILDTRLDALLERDTATLLEVVRECVALKSAVVAADPREGGVRAVLNYGHTVGHALEAATGYAELLHGEAVALGMGVAGRLSVALTGCPPDDVVWQDATLRRCSLGAASASARRLDPAALLARTAGDKKALGGRARWVLLAARGSALTGREVPDDAARSAIGAVLGA